MKLDTTTVHNDRVATVVGDFNGTPVYSMDIAEVDFDAARESRRAVLAAQNQAEPSVSTAELNAGEAVCPDNVIRRGTTLEVRGDEYYNAVKDPENTQRISIGEARTFLGTEGVTMTWRPNKYRASDARELFWDANGKPADKNAVQRDAMVFNDDTDYALLHEEVTE
jgi:1,6-anhydro-N-acetylmuramate kinase